MRHCKKQILFLATFFIFLSGCTLTDIQSEIKLTSAKVNLSASNTVPSILNSNWQSVSLEDNWKKSHPDQNGYAWYKLNFDLKKPVNELWAIYIPHVNMNAEVWLNGRKLGSGGEMTGYVSRNWNQPQYFVIPQGFLTLNTNTLQIRLITLPNLGGALSAIHLGPHALLHNSYTQQYLWQVTSALASSVLLLIALSLFFALWFYCRTEKFFLLATITCIAWFLNSFRFYIINIEIDPAIIFRLDQVLLLWVVITFTLTISYYFYNKILKPFKYLAGIALMTTLSAFLIPEEFVFIFAITIQIISLITAFSLNILALIYAYKSRLWVDIYLCFGMFVGTGLGMHDALGLSGAFTDTYFHMAQYGAILPISSLGWIIILRFSRALIVSNNYNTELALKINEKHHELKQSFEKLNQLEKEKAISAEQERVMRDIHDGVGAHIVSTLAMLEVSPSLKKSDISAGLKDALNELRNLIDSLDSLTNDIPTILAILRERFESRFNKANISIIWKLQVPGNHPKLSPEFALHLIRILQEILINVIKHANATTISIAIEDMDNRPVIRILDNGSGFDENETHGHGIKNMKYRANLINVQLKLQSSKKGTEVILRF